MLRQEEASVLQREDELALPYAQLASVVAAGDAAALLIFVASGIVDIMNARPVSKVNPVSQRLISFA